MKLYNLHIEIREGDCMKLDKLLNKYHSHIKFFGDYDGYLKSFDGEYMKELSKTTNIPIGELHGLARRVTNVVKEINEFFYTHDYKQDVFYELVKVFPSKSIVMYSQSLEFMSSFQNDPNVVIWNSKVKGKRKGAKHLITGSAISGFDITVNSSYTSSIREMQKRIEGSKVFINLVLKRSDGKQNLEADRWLKEATEGLEFKNIYDLNEIEL